MIGRLLVWCVPDRALRWRMPVGEQLRALFGFAGYGGVVRRGPTIPVTQAMLDDLPGWLR